MIDSKKVIRFGRNGKPGTVLNSNSLWTVTSGLFDNAGNVWVMENSATNEVRVRKIDRQSLAAGKVGGSNPGQTHLLITIFTGLVGIILFLIVRVILNKNNQTQFSS